MRTWRCLCLSVVMILGALAAPTAQAAPIVQCNLAIAMSDGIDLRANITRPGAGVHPTILTVTGYNKDLGNPTGNCSAGDAGLTAAGYNVVVVDDRGTGSSGGRWDIWSERTQLDYVELLDWLTAQPWQDGNVGTTGGSYLGITSLLVAANDAKRAVPAVKAVFADVPMADAYRDVTYFGGNLDTGFIPVWFGFTGATNANVPTQLFQGEINQKVALNTVDHLAGGPAYVGPQLVAHSLLGTKDGLFQPFDQPTTRLRSPGDRAPEIGAAVFYTGGWFDIFQRGEAYLFNQLTGVPANGKKWVQSAQYHSAGDAQWDSMGYGSKTSVKIKWFDHWLKGVDNGVEQLPPITQLVVGGDRWETPSAWPAPETDWTSFYLSPETSGSARSINDATLSTTAPSTGVQQILPFTPVGGICNRSTAQWAAGAPSASPCTEDQQLSEPITLTYTTPPLTEDLHIAGPMAFDLWAQVDRYDTSFYTALTDVAPDGTSTQITSGGLNASHRALDESRTIRNADGDVILPFHPFSVAAQRDVQPNIPTEYQIEVFPTNWVLKAGHRLRLVIGTADTPHYAVPADQLQKMLGGTVRVLQGGGYSSRLLVPVQPS